MRFQNRREAGRALARRLAEYANREDVIVLALPRGGVPVGYEVARALRAPLDVFVVRKLGTPGNEELAMGAIASGGARAMNEDVVRYLNISDEAIEAVAEREQQELNRRERAYRGTRPLLDVAGRTVILVDDGLATGATMRAAVAALLARQPAQIVVAAPVAAATTCEMIEGLAEKVVCLCDQEPDSLFAIGLWYDDFTQLTDQEVRELLGGQPRARASSREPSLIAGR
ncbi:MAG: phosphoribosyltransferase [Blastocatellia bacterium]|nr:phosphoribosyltransferase [Blastocatellia bacterium]